MANDEMTLEPEPQQFIVDNFSKAEWAARKIVEQQANIQNKTEEARKMKEDYAAIVDEWLKSETEDAQKDIDSLQAKLIPFVSEQIEGKKKKSIKLPSATAGFKKSGAKFTIGGEKVDGKSEQLLEIVKKHNLDEYIITKEYVDWYKLKKTLNVVSDGVVVSQDGEILQNIEAEPETDVFYVKAN